jgi:hypothetical protein
MSFSFGTYSSQRNPIYASGNIPGGSPFAINSVGYKDIVFTEITDNRSAYDGTTFTAPEDGTYYICVTGRGISSPYITVSINGTDDTTYEIQIATGNIFATYQKIVVLTASQTVKVRGKQNPSELVNATFSIFRM